MERATSQERVLLCYTTHMKRFVLWARDQVPWFYRQQRDYRWYELEHACMPEERLMSLAPNIPRYATIRIQRVDVAFVPDVSSELAWLQETQYGLSRAWLEPLMQDTQHHVVLSADDEAFLGRRGMSVRDFQQRVFHGKNLLRPWQSDEASHQAALDQTYLSIHRHVSHIVARLLVQTSATRLVPVWAPLFGAGLGTLVQAIILSIGGHEARAMPLAAVGAALAVAYSVAGRRSLSQRYAFWDRRMYWFIWSALLCVTSVIVPHVALLLAFATPGILSYAKYVDYQQGAERLQDEGKLRGRSASWLLAAREWWWHPYAVGLAFGSVLSVLAAVANTGTGITWLIRWLFFALFPYLMSEIFAYLGAIRSHQQFRAQLAGIQVEENTKKE